jgi:hypothetical protein
MPFRLILRCAALAGLAVAVATPAAAADAPPLPRFNIMGPSTCADWPKSGAITSASKAVPLNWTLGFVSGWAAFANLKLLDVVEPDQVDVWMTAYCKDNPTSTIPAAARELERDLESKLPPPPPPPAPIVMPPPKPPEAKPAPAAKPKPRPARRAPARPKPAA